jgi:hypothetical protein
LKNEIKIKENTTKEESKKTGEKKAEIKKKTNQQMGSPLRTINLKYLVKSVPGKGKAVLATAT